MTIQAWWLLRKLKKVQKHSDNYFIIDLDNLTATRYPEDEGKPRKANLKAYANSLTSTLDYLVSCQSLEWETFSIGQVTHSGWHRGQIIMGKVLLFLFRSIAVPVVVSFLTALVTVLISGALQAS